MSHVKNFEPVTYWGGNYHNLPCPDRSAITNPHKIIRMSMREKVIRSVDTRKLLHNKWLIQYKWELHYKTKWTNKILSCFTVHNIKKLTSENYSSLLPSSFFFFFFLSSFYLSPSHSMMVHNIFVLPSVLKSGRTVRPVPQKYVILSTMDPKRSSSYGL